MKQWMKKLNKLSPPGYDLSLERNFCMAAAITAVLLNLNFFSTFSVELQELYVRLAGGEKILKPDAVMPYFAEILGDDLLLFVFAVICALTFIGHRYFYFYRGSKSIYLMRRLPDAGLLHRQCWVLPCLWVLADILLALLLFFLFYGCYLIFTPEAAMQPGQWEKIWEVFSC